MQLSFPFSPPVAPSVPYTIMSLAPSQFLSFLAAEDALSYNVGALMSSICTRYLILTCLHSGCVYASVLGLHHHLGRGGKFQPDVTCVHPILTFRIGTATLEVSCDETRI